MKKLLLLLLFFLFSGTIYVHAQTPVFLIANGKDLKYNGQTVILKGANFDNIPALGATIGENGDTIGSGNIDDINHDELDYSTLAQQGGNVARLGLSFNWYSSNKTKFFQVMDQHVAWARKHNVWIIFNMFTTPGDCYEGYNEYCNIWTNTTQKNQLKAFWVDMANHYKNEPAVAGFDLLNEPTPPGPGWSNTWDALAQEITTAIRAVDTNHLIFIESTSDPIFLQLFTGGNIVYESHFYTPMGLTHGDQTSTQLYPGSFTDWFSGEHFTVTLNKTTLSGGGDSRVDIRNMLPINWANQNNVPFFVGEWGSRATSPGYDQYIADVASLFQQWGVNHTHYTWKHDPTNWKWGIYARSTSGLTLAFPEMLAAVKLSWQNAVRPAFTATTNPTPTQSTTNPSPTTASGPTPTPFVLIPNPPSWWNSITPTLRNFLEQLYALVYYFNRPSNLAYLLDGIGNGVPTPGSSSPTAGQPTATPRPPTPTPTPAAIPTGGPTAPASTGALKVQGTTLMTPNNQRFIVKGMNVEFYRDSGCGFITTGQYPKRTQIATAMKNIGVNAVRLNYSLGYLGQNSQNLTQFLDVMQAFTNQGMYVMPSDHALTGNPLDSRASSYPLFSSIINGARSRGIESYLIMNPFNEPGPMAWSAWVTGSKDIVTRLRNTDNFQGVIVLDGQGWASSIDTGSFQQLITHDASLRNGTPNIAFSTHWYPNHDLSSRVVPALNAANTVPLMIGELGQINPGTTGVVSTYPRDVLNAVVQTAIPNGHNGVFPWMWNWCDENGMTNDDFLTLNTYGQMYVTNYFSKL